MNQKRAKALRALAKRLVKPMKVSASGAMMVVARGLAAGPHGSAINHPETLRGIYRKLKKEMK